ncbi:MAG: type II toxin-antitoxin system VapC family toxin [Rhodothermales bacterium]
MRRVFADTFYWVALINPRDSAHAQVAGFTLSTQPAVVVTTEEVLTEVLNFFAEYEGGARGRAAQVIELILERPDVRVLPQSTSSFRDGLDLYAARLDKGYSLTNCIPMAAMRREGLREVLTEDYHFTQEGFTALFL